MNNNCKYPISLFVAGVFMNFTKNILLLLPGVVLLIVGIWVKWCLYVGLALLLVNVVVSVLEQIQIRNAALNSKNPNFIQWQDAMLSPDWKENIKDLVESRIDVSAERSENEDNNV